jgi:hypothetical protein
LQLVSAAQYQILPASNQSIVCIHAGPVWSKRDAALDNGFPDLPVGQRYLGECPRWWDIAVIVMLREFAQLGRTEICPQGVEHPLPARGHGQLVVLTCIRMVLKVARAAIIWGKGMLREIVVPPSGLKAASSLK